MAAYPGGGIYIVQGEISALMASMKKVHWSARSYLEEENNPLLKNLNELKVLLNQITDLREIELNTFLGPFLEIIHSSETTVQVTTLALSSINKFITYGLIGGITDIELLPIVENIAETVSHANFITTDYPSDAVILMKIVEVLRTLVMSSLGILLSNDSICEIMLSCFRICFEVRLNELLRQNAEHCLRDIVRMLFQRLPLFTQSSISEGANYKKMRIRSKIVDPNQKKRKKTVHTDKNLQPTALVSENTAPVEIQTTKTSEPVTSVEVSSNNTHSEDLKNTEHSVSSDTNQFISDENLISGQNIDNEKGTSLLDNKTEATVTDNTAVNHDILDSDDQCKQLDSSNICMQGVYDTSEKTQGENKETTDKMEINGNVDNENVTVSSTEPNYQSFTFQRISQESVNYHLNNNSQGEEHPVLEPHNSVCVQELLRFLSVICNPHDKQNTDVMIHVSLSLLVIALEVGANSIGKHPTLLNIIKDTLCRNLLSLLQMEKLQIFTMNLHVSFLIFESMRNHLKFQLEYYLTRLSDIIILDASKIPYEKKEIALESLVQLWKIPGLVTELFLNYDCDLYCPNLYEEITKLLSKNVYPVAGIYNTHLLSLDALLTVVESIEKHCHSRISSEKNIDPDGKFNSEINNANGRDSSYVEPNKNQPDGTILNIPTHEQLMAIKRKKKLIAIGTEHFNANAKKGIQFLQEQGLLSTPLEPSEVANFLKENPHLDKKMIGEFISHRNNMHVLESFVKSFDFIDMRIDEALRVYLETFRLPGESPLISLVMQQFADHWHKCNNEPFAKSDAAFVLAYAVIMLNVDQHNQIVRRQNTPMTIDDFKKNLKGVDGGKDFDQDLLEEIYQAIKNEEIVMPAEHTGLLKENYLWKVLLRRGLTKDGRYILAHDGLYDHELFSICWGPVVTALGYVFDKAMDSSIYYKSIQGFRKCATISAHYGMSNEFDYLTLSLCKFTTLLSPFDNPDSFVISFGMNSKGRLAARTVFSLVHRYGDILREGWKPIFDCIFQLFRCKLLPKILVEAEDFLELSGKVSIVRDDPSSQKNTESGILSSLYSYITLATEASSQKFTTDEEQECTEIAKTCIIDCHLENLILESKFLRLESLHELLKVLIKACYNSDNKISVINKQEEDKAIFFLELLLKVVIQNRDRVNTLWPIVCDHMSLLLLTAANSQQQFLVERCVIGFLRLAIRLMRKEEISSSVLQSLNTLMLLKWSTLSPVSRQIAYGLHELIKTGAVNIHTATDWNVIFTLLELVGAGAPLSKLPPIATSGRPQSDTNTPDIVEGCVLEKLSSDDTNTEGVAEDSGLGGDKLYLSGSDSSLNRVIPSPTGSSFHLESKDLDSNMTTPMSDDLMPHDPFALVKCCESLAFLVRDVAHITPFNFEHCVRCTRTFVEATFYSGEKRAGKKKPNSKTRPNRKSVTKKTKSHNSTNYGNPYDADESDPDEYPDSYYQVPLQLLDLMHTLHTRTAQIYRWWAEEISETDVSGLWPRGWCPLLQGISRLCYDPRKQVRMNAITYLQRALLVHDLQALTADEWSSCFNKVLFPLMDKLLEPLNDKDHAGMEETRMRAATLLSKVFLHHLTPLQTLSSFTTLWLRILDFMDKYMNIDKHGDLLNEAIQESVKNMLLVMESANLFLDENNKGSGQWSFWEATWQRVDQFLPNLKDELYRHHSPIHELNEQQTMASLSSPLSSMEYNRDIETETTKKENEVSGQNSSIDITKQSVPIFPHMGQLISTRIGPVMDKEFTSVSNLHNESLSPQGLLDNAENTTITETIEKEEFDISRNSHHGFNTTLVSTTRSEEEEEDINDMMRFSNGGKLPPSNHTELSSLITTSSDFLATLPSVKPHTLSSESATLSPHPEYTSIRFPVYSGFVQSNNDHSIGKENNASQFFYQNLDEYQSVAIDTMATSREPVDSVITSETSTIAVSSNVAKLVQEP